MDMWRVALWAFLMAALGLVYSLMNSADYVALVMTWWLTALVGAVLIYYAPRWSEDPDQNPYWLWWALGMALYLTAYGFWLNGDWWGVTMWWHWSVALVSAFVMHYAAPWGRKYLPA